jgi:predicted Zn-dependent peptidase
MISRDVYDNGLCLLTESMPDVRSVSLGVWLTRGSRHEGDAAAGMAHFAEHMLFKGTTTRTAEDIAQQVDSMGGQLDAFTAKECTSYYVKVLDEHLPRAVDLLADLLLRPAFHADDIDREKKVILEEIKMVEDMPDDLVHELFTSSFWPDHPLGRSILGSPASVGGITGAGLRAFFERSYIAGNLVIAVAGNLEHAAVRDLIGAAFGGLPAAAGPADETPPAVRPSALFRGKEIEQSHLCLGTQGYAQAHGDRYPSYVLNTVLGGSMSSRLFQNIREKRGLAYAVSSGLESYRDVGILTIYAGCDAAAVPEVVDLVVAELRNLRDRPIAADELQRAKDHLKGNLVLGLESTANRMSQLARSEIYFGRQIDLAEHLEHLDAITAGDVQRVAADLFSRGGLAATVVGPEGGAAPSAGQLDIG